MPHHLRNFLLTLGLVFGSSLAATVAMAAEPLRLAVSLSPLSLPLFVAESQGYFAAEGLPIKIDKVVGGHRALQQVLEGTADVATSSEAVVMFNSFKSSDFAVIATFVTSDNDVKVVTRSNSGISRPQQLEGKRVGTVVGAASHYYLDTLLIMSGVAPEAVQVRNLQPESMADALKNAEVDAVAIWEPIPFKIANNTPGTRILPKAGAYVLTFNLVAHKRLRGVRDDDLVKLLRAIERAESFINAEPVKSQAILRNQLQLDQAFIDWIWPSYHYRLSLDLSLIRTLEGEARWARQEGHVKSERSPNYLDFIYSSPLHKVLPHAVIVGD